jgi:integration host factor subunit alpha
MTKAEIVQALYTRVGGFSRKESAELVDLVFEMMKETLGRGEKIKVSGFGNFVLRDKRQRPGRNPQTGDPIKISERRVLTFKASQILKQILNPRSGLPSVTTNGTPHAAAPVGAAAALGAESSIESTKDWPLGADDRGGLPPKLYFRIGEVASLVGVEPHVLRYWEREFRSVRPTKSAKGQRVYSRRDVETLTRVRDLLYSEGFTIAGARKKLQKDGHEPRGDDASRTPHLREQLLELRAEIQGFLEELGA